MEGEREGGTSATWPGKMAIEQMGKNGPLKKFFSCHCFFLKGGRRLSWEFPSFSSARSQSKPIEAKVNATRDRKPLVVYRPVPSNRVCDLLWVCDLRMMFFIIWFHI